MQQLILSDIEYSCHGSSPCLFVVTCAAKFFHHASMIALDNSPSDEVAVWRHLELPRARGIPFFPRASERRVLPIVGVCKTSSHLHIFSSSYLLIFTSSHLHICSPSSAHLHICSSSSSSHPHIFTSSHLHIFSSSHLHILSCPLALLPSCSLLLFYVSLEGAGQCQRDGTKRNPFARNEVRSPKIEVKLRFHLFGRNTFARNEVRSPNIAVKLRFPGFRRNPFARNEVRSPKIEAKLGFHLSGPNHFARNEVRSPKTEVKLRFASCPAKCVKAPVCKSFCV